MFLAKRLRNVPSDRVLVGVDGCHGGWIALVQDRERQFEVRVVADWVTMMAELPSRVLVGVDIPMGLPGKGSRQCDVEARKRLGQPRGSSVFPAPVRGVLKSGLSHREISDAHQRIDGRGLSQQAYRLLPKIMEVDRYLREDVSRQQRVIEIHPEVSFAVWNRGRSMGYRKSKLVGRAERECLIDREWPGVRERVWDSVRAEDCERDDLNDAFAALWTVRRIVVGEAETLSLAAEFDEMGLRMEITA
jgi:predicted RNase H-like nuclease